MAAHSRSDAHRGTSVRLPHGRNASDEITVAQIQSEQINNNDSGVASGREEGASANPSRSTNGRSQPSRLQGYFGPGGQLRPFRLLKQDLGNLKVRYLSDWTVFNQQVVASAIYIFFTNILPGITFASDLYSLTGQSWGTIEIVFSTGLCGVIFAA